MRTFICACVRGRTHRPTYECVYVGRGCEFVCVHSRYIMCFGGHGDIVLSMDLKLSIHERYATRPA